MGWVEVVLFKLASMGRQTRGEETMSYRVSPHIHSAHHRSYDFCRVGLNNFAHPRTDAVVIMAVVNETNDKILLGRNVRRCSPLLSAPFIDPLMAFYSVNGLASSIQRSLGSSNLARRWKILSNANSGKKLALKCGE